MTRAEAARLTDAVREFVRGFARWIALHPGASDEDLRYTAQHVFSVEAVRADLTVHSEDIDDEQVTMLYRRDNHRTLLAVITSTGVPYSLGPL